MPRLLNLLLPTLLTAPLLSTAGIAQEQPTLSPSQLEILGESLAAYEAAQSDSKGLTEARLRVGTTLSTLTVELQGESPLHSPLDLSLAAMASRDYPDEKQTRGKVQTDSYERGSFEGGGMEYAFRLPKDYAPGKSRYTLILAIPDEGERPAEHIQTNWLSKELKEGAIVFCPQMPSIIAEWDRVMVSGRPGGLSHVLTALRIATDRFAVDYDNIFVAGRGKGVPAAVAAGNYSPHRFAGVIGRAGDAGEMGPDNFSNLPTLFAGGGANASAFEEASKKAGMKNCTVAATARESDVAQWIQKRSRLATPHTVTLVPGDPFPTRAYWLRVAPMAFDSSTTAVCDRESNTISIDGSGISQVTLYLNDLLVDLGKPVRVICNGVETTTLLTPRLSPTLSMLLDGTSDLGCVYSIQVSFDMTGTPARSVMATQGEIDKEFESTLAAAEGNAQRLWQLHLWCESTKRTISPTRVLTRLIRIEPGHQAARAALGHVAHDGKWFDSQAALDRFLVSQDASTAVARGLTLSKPLWIHSDEREFAQKRRVKDHNTGQWITTGERKRLDSGWARQDLAWIAPEDVTKVDDGLWFVNGEWLNLSDANQAHSAIESMWTIPSAQVVLHSTASRATTLQAIEQMSRAITDLRKVFGAEPAMPLDVVVLKDEEQYDRFAFGDPDGRRVATHAGRLQAIHSAYFAESLFEQVDKKFEYRGAGACFWDALVPNGDLYGLHSARLAVGLSYANALDPATKAVKKARRDGPTLEFFDAFQAEQQMPTWLRYGGAVYGERFFFDTTTPGDGDAWWARKWSKGNLIGKGGMRALDDVFAMQLNPDDREDSQRQLLEAGLLVSFIVDGNCAPVMAAHAELKEALASGRAIKKQLAALEEALLANEAKITAYAAE